MVVKVDAQDISGREEKDRSEFDESVLCITQKWFSVYVCRLLKLYWYSWLQDYHYISPGSSNENNLRYIVKTSFTEYIYIYISQISLNSLSISRIYLILYFHKLSNIFKDTDKWTLYNCNFDIDINIINWLIVGIVTKYTLIRYSAM